MALDPQSVRCLIFDLDDTLFDTHGLLVRPATTEACEAMIRAGLKASLEECIEERRRIFASHPRKNIYVELAKHFGVRGGTTVETVAQEGFNAFHDREIKEDIRLFPEARETLKNLKTKFRLVLVTLGTPKTQIEKVDLLRLAPFFDDVTYVNVAREKTKTGAFKEVMSKFKDLKPDMFVSIGNRVDSDIRNAKDLGMQTILMVHGEYEHLEPQHPHEIPDARIKNLTELPKILQISTGKEVP